MSADSSPSTFVRVKPFKIERIEIDKNSVDIDANRLLKERCQDLSNQVEDREATIKELLESIKDYSIQVRSLIETLAEKDESMERNIIKATTEVSETVTKELKARFGAQIEAANEKIAEVRSENHLLRSELDSLASISEKEKEGLERALEESHNECLMLEKTYDGALKDLRTRIVKEELLRQETELSTRNTLCKAFEQLEQLVNEKTALEDDLTRVKASQVSLQHQVSQDRENFDIESKDYLAKIASLNEDLQLQTQTVQLLSNEKMALAQQLATLQNEYSSIQEKMAQQDMVQKSLTSELEEKITSLNEDLQLQTQTVRLLSNEKMALDEQLVTLQDEHSSIQEKMLQKEAAHKSTVSELEDKCAKIASLNEDLQLQTQTVQLLSDEKMALAQLLATLQNEHSSIQEKMVQQDMVQKSLISELEDKCARLSKSLDEKNKKDELVARTIEAVQERLRKK